MKTDLKQWSTFLEKNIIEPTEVDTLSEFRALFLLVFVTITFTDRAPTYQTSPKKRGRCRSGPWSAEQPHRNTNCEMKN